MDEPVEDGIGIGRIADRVVPALDWDLRGQDRGATLVAIVDDLHQVATLLGGKPGHGPIVDYEQLYPGELGEQAGGLAVDAGQGDLSHWKQRPRKSAWPTMRGTPAIRSVRFDEPVLRVDEIEDAGDPEFGSELLSPHRSSFSCRP